MKRIFAIAGQLFFACIVFVALDPGAIHAQQKDVEIGVVEALTGPWSANGNRMLAGEEMAVEEINASGGIKSLGGAKLKLVTTDASARPDEANAAAQRVIASNPDLVGGMGAYISSQQLAITEVSEKAGLPWLVMGSTNQLTDRGFKDVFATNMPANLVAPRIVPLMEEFSKTNGNGNLKDVAIVAVNTPGTIGVADGVEEILKGKGINVVAKEVFAIQLSDGSVIAQRLRRARPSFILFSNALAPDAKTILTSLAQVGITPKNTPIFIYGGGGFDPELLGLMSKESLEGLTIFSAVWPTKNSADFLERFKKRTGQPWMTFESAFGYGHVYLLRDAIEKAASTDRSKVADSMRSLNVTSGPAVTALNGPVSFDKNGLRKEFSTLLIQWQNGVPIAVYPSDVALAPPLKVAR